MPLQFINSTKGKYKLLIDENFVYERSKLGADGKVIWKCRNYESTKCRGRCHTRNDKIIHKTSHNHEATSRSIHLREINLQIKGKAQNTMDSTQHILAEVFENTPSQAVLAQLPQVSSIKERIRKIRR